MVADTSTQPNKPSIGDYLKNNIREYGLLVALVVIMLFFQFVTNGVLFRPVNITNLVLQNSFIVIMALGMLLIIVAGHIDLSVGSIVAFIGAISAIMLVQVGPAGLRRHSCLSCRRRHHGGGAGLLGRLSEDPVLHRHACRHAGLPRADLRGARRPADRSVPEGVSAAFDRLRSGFPVASSIRGTDLDPEHGGAGGGAGTRRLRHLCGRAQSPGQRAAR